jgi:hypothetical protein
MQDRRKVGMNDTRDCVATVECFIDIHWLDKYTAQQNLQMTRQMQPQCFSITFKIQTDGGWSRVSKNKCHMRGAANTKVLL